MTLEITGDAPAGPSAEEEAALLAADRGSEEFYGQVPKADSLEPAAPEESLPPMEDLVKRIPGPARALVEELFRARFVTVKRVPRSALKS
jgi:hypothetical protein